MATPKFAKMIMLSMPLLSLTCATAQAETLTDYRIRFEQARDAYLASNATADATCAHAKEVKRRSETVDEDVKSACMADIQKIAKARKAEGMSRAQIKREVSPLIFECRAKAQGATDQEVLSSQKQCLAALDEVLELQQAYKTARDEYQSAYEYVKAIADQKEEQNRLKLEIERNNAEIEASRRRQAEMLEEAERILQSLASQ